jgi:hypothetical protein
MDQKLGIYLGTTLYNILLTSTLNFQWWGGGGMFPPVFHQACFSSSINFFARNLKVRVSSMDMIYVIHLIECMIN